jgi:hypothetical protein
MGRKRINEDHTPARLPAGTLDRIEAVLREREKRADFIRAAIERELRRREGTARTVVETTARATPRKPEKIRKK